VYWEAEGRRSVDAVVVAVCVGFLIILGFDPLRGNGYTASATGDLAEATIAVNLCFAVVCILKGKYWTGFLGIFVPLVAFVGAVRVARPKSPWARWRYKNKPRNMAKAQRREDHNDATWRSWRESFFDLIAGKPHLPDVLRPAARPREAPDDEAGGRRGGGGRQAGAADLADSRRRPSYLAGCLRRLQAAQQLQHRRRDVGVVMHQLPLRALARYTLVTRCSIVSCSPASVILPASVPSS